MISALHFEFMRNALLAALLASVLCGVLGTLVVIRRYVILTGGVAHVAYGGVGLAMFLGISPRIGALAFSLVAALLMSRVMLREEARSDTIIGAMWAIGMAAGVIFTDLTPGYGADFMSYLFGSILAVSRTDLLMMAAIAVVSIVTVVFFYKDLQAFVFDEIFAVTRGVPVRMLHTVLVVLISLSVVVIIRVVGLILVIALFTIPPHIAEGFSRSMAQMMILSTFLGIAFTLSGLWLAYRYDLTSGAVIILVAAAVYFLVLAARALLKRS